MPESDPTPAWQRYRLGAQARSREGYQDTATGADFADARPFLTRAEDAKPKGRWRLHLGGLSGEEIAILAVSLSGLILASAFFLADAGPAKAGGFALLALIPLVLVTSILLWTDRVAPLPWRFHVVALLWGAGVATTIAGIVNGAIETDLVYTLGDVEDAQTLTAVVVAPLAEELFKGAGALLTLLLAWKFLSSRSNGLIVGALVGAGFAFVENILYFVTAHSEGSVPLGLTIMGRAVLSPFVHPMATSFTGLFIALAIMRARTVWGWTWRMGAGFLLAVLIHAMWNGFALLGAFWLLAYFLVELPIFLTWFIWVLRQPRRQLPLVRQGLAPYMATGWISGEEVEMVATRPGRKHANKWAKRVGRPAQKSVRGYLREAGRLGLGQTRMEETPPSAAQLHTARKTLGTLQAHRDSYLDLGREYAFAQQASGQGPSRDRGHAAGPGSDSASSSEWSYDQAGPDR